MSHILVVEDDRSISEWIAEYLTNHGFQVSVANRGDIAVELIEEDHPDLVLLDILLPEKNGFEVCKEVRTFYSAPILMITACSSEADEVKGLELGADDYVTKPVRLPSLLARINALLRRKNLDNEGPKVHIFGNGRIDSLTRTVSINDIDVSITSNEFDVIWELASQAGNVVSREELVRLLRGFDYDGFDRAIDLRVSRLRKKLNKQPKPPFEIKTVWGKGYIFVINDD